MSEAEEREGERVIQALVREIDPSVQCEVGPRDFDSGVHPVRLVSGNRETTLKVSREDMEDLPATREIKEEMKQRLHYAIQGIQVGLSREYVTKNGLGFRFKSGFEGLSRSYNRPAFEFPFEIEEIEGKGPAARGVVRISRFILRTLLSDSEQAVRVCINRLRAALDNDGVRFGQEQISIHADDEWVRALLYPAQVPRATDEEIRQFIGRKLYWVGYIIHGIVKSIALDELVDCEYLGVRPIHIRRNAEFLEQQGFLRLERQAAGVCAATPTAGLVSRKGELYTSPLTLRNPKIGFTQ